MIDLDLPQSDKQSDACHPRETLELFGQNLAEKRFLNAFNNNNLHHAWLISGSSGIGKATLAWRIAKFLFVNQSNNSNELFKEDTLSSSLDIDHSHPVNPRLRALSEPNLFLLRRLYDEEKKRFRSNIAVDQVRKLNHFFALSSTDSKRRVVIIDSVDDLNNNSANALLKSLEEPPKDCLFLLISHQPAALLPTIKSRCIELRCQKLSSENMYKALNTSNIDTDTLSDGLINLSDGSVGNAIRLSNYNALSIYKSIVEIVETFPNLNGNLAIALSEQASKKGNDQILNIIVELIELVISRLAYSGLGKLTEELIQNEKIILNSVSNTEKHAKSWADLVGKLRKKINYAITVNIDPGTLILDTLFTMNQTSQQLRLRNST